MLLEPTSSLLRQQKNKAASNKSWAVGFPAPSAVQSMPAQCSCTSFPLLGITVSAEKERLCFPAQG